MIEILLQQVGKKFPLEIVLKIENDQSLFITSGLP